MGCFYPIFLLNFLLKKLSFFLLDTIGNYFDLIKNSGAIENSSVKRKKLAFFCILFYNFKCLIQNYKFNIERSKFFLVPKWIQFYAICILYLKRHKGYSL